MITKGAETFGQLYFADTWCLLFPLLTFSITVLEGANPSAEGEDADEGGDAGGADQRVLDIEDQFRLNKIEAKPSKKAFQGEIKSTTVSGVFLITG
jgi:hypothetical protein